MLWITFAEGLHSQGLDKKLVYVAVSRRECCGSWCLKQCPTRHRFFFSRPNLFLLSSIQMSNGSYYLILSINLWDLLPIYLTISPILDSHFWMDFPCFCPISCVFIGCQVLTITFYACLCLPYDFTLISHVLFHKIFHLWVLHLPGFPCIAFPLPSFSRSW